MVDCVNPEETSGETKHGKTRECKTRRDVAEAEENNNPSAMVKR